jgi:hypothetical protein
MKKIFFFLPLLLVFLSGYGQRNLYLNDSTKASYLKINTSSWVEYPKAMTNSLGGDTSSVGTKTISIRWGNGITTTINFLTTNGTTDTIYINGTKQTNYINCYNKISSIMIPSAGAPTTTVTANQGTGGSSAWKIFDVNGRANDSIVAGLDAIVSKLGGGSTVNQGTAGSFAWKVADTGLSSGNSAIKSKQSGTWTVGLTGTPSVTIGGTLPGFAITPTFNGGTTTGNFASSSGQTLERATIDSLKGYLKALKDTIADNYFWNLSGEVHDSISVAVGSISSNYATAALFTSTSIYTKIVAHIVPIGGTFTSCIVTIQGSMDNGASWQTLGSTLTAGTQNVLVANTPISTGLFTQVRAKFTTYTCTSCSATSIYIAIWVAP